MKSIISKSILIVDDDKDILEFGKRIGKKLDKFVKFKLSVKGSDIPNDIPLAELKNPPD